MITQKHFDIVLGKVKSYVLKLFLASWLCMIFIIVCAFQADNIEKVNVAHNQLQSFEK